MFEKLGAFFNLFRKGSEVANAQLWKTGGISVAALSAALLALVNVGDVLGLHIILTQAQSDSICGGVITFVGVVLPLITSKKVGLLPAKTDEPAPIEDHSFGAGVPTATSRVQPSSGTDYESCLDGLDTTLHQ